MAIDRLAALRAQRQQQDGSPRSQAHEMTGLPSNDHPSTMNGHEGGGTPTFLSEITSIQDGIDQLNANVSRISELHSRSLNAMGETSQQDAAQLDTLTTETRTLSNSLKERIKKLEAFPASGQDVQIRKNRTGLVRAKFLEALQTYQQVEQQHRAKSRQRVERQFKIVKPDATPDEVAAVVNDSGGGGDQIFAQALTSSTRYGDSRTAYREVQERHQDILRMEQTLAELAQLFNDMGTLVEQQDPTINAIETTAANVEENTEAGLKSTAKAVISARNARKMRWICFIICLIIAAAIAIALGVVFGAKK